MGLKEALHPEYETIIYDQKGTYYSKKKEVDLLNEACILKDGADYSGKVKAIRTVLEYTKKTPLIISLQESIYTFPTKSPDHFDCRWVFPQHIYKYDDKNGKNRVIFNNGEQFDINCSPYTFRKQWYRSSHCIIYYSKPSKIQIVVKE